MRRDNPPIFFLGLDLGQSADPTALAILERIEPKPEIPPLPLRRVIGEPLPKPIVKPHYYQCRHMHRYPLGTRYPAIVEDVAELLSKPEIKGKCDLIVDASGVGRPVVDMFSAAGLSRIAVTITGGVRATSEGGMWSVPKRILVGTLQVLLQGERLQFADVPARANLIKELLAFQVTITEAANDTYAGRTGTHDDLVLAVALAAWWAERPSPGPAPRSVTYQRSWLHGI